MVQFSRSVVSDSLRFHGLQHARPLCLSSTPWVYPNSCPLSWWCHSTISSSAVPFSSLLQSFPASGSFPVSQSLVFIGRTDVEAETPVLWPPVLEHWLIWKDPYAGKDWGQEEKRVIRGWDGWITSWLNGYKFEQTLGDSGGQRA